MRISTVPSRLRDKLKECDVEHGPGREPEPDGKDDHKLLHEQKRRDGHDGLGERRADAVEDTSQLAEFVGQQGDGNGETLRYVVHGQRGADEHTETTRGAERHADTHALAEAVQGHDEYN